MNPSIDACIIYKILNRKNYLLILFTLLKFHYFDFHEIIDALKIIINNSNYKIIYK